MHGLDSPPHGGDRLDVGHAQRGFDDHLDADPLGDLPCRLDLRQERVHQIDVSGHAHLRNHHDVEPVARLLHDVHDVPVHIVSVDSVDADRDRLAASAPVHLQQRADHVLPRLLLVPRGDGVLQIEDQSIGGKLLGFLQRACVRAGHVKHAAAWSHHHLGLRCIWRAAYFKARRSAMCS